MADESQEREIDRRTLIKSGGAAVTSGIIGYELGYRRAKSQTPKDSDGDLIPDAVDTRPNKKNPNYTTNIEQTVEIQAGDFYHLDISVPNGGDKRYLMDYEIEVIDGPAIDVITLSESDFKRYKQKNYQNVQPLFGTSFGVESKEYESIHGGGDVFVIDNTEVGTRESEIPTGTATVKLEVKIHPQVSPTARLRQSSGSGKYPPIGDLILWSSIGVMIASVIYGWATVAKSAYKGNELTWKQILWATLPMILIVGIFLALSAL